MAVILSLVKRIIKGGCAAGLALALALSVSFVAHRREARRLNGFVPATLDAGSWPLAHVLPEKRNEAVAYARSMLTTPYDPLMGMYGDPFGKVGFVVCIDVPVRAYKAAGVSLPALLRESAKAHPDWFQIGPQNPPSSPFFYRRVRNYYDLFQHHPWLEFSGKPEVGDWAFYGKSHIALVEQVRPDGSFEVIEASPRKMRVAESDGEYMARTWGPPAFFGRLHALGDAEIRAFPMDANFRKLFKPAK